MSSAGPFAAEKVTFAAGATLALSDAQKTAAAQGWTTVLTAKALSGLPQVAGGYQVRTLTVDGQTAVQAKAVRGLLLLVK